MCVCTYIYTYIFVCVCVYIYIYAEYVCPVKWLKIRLGCLMMFFCLLPPNKNISPSNSWYLDSIQTVVLTVQIYWTNAAWITCIQLEMLLLKAHKWLWTDFTSTLPSTSNLCSILVQFLSQVKNVYSWWIEMYRFWSKLIQNKLNILSYLNLEGEEFVF